MKVGAIWFKIYQFIDDISNPLLMQRFLSPRNTKKTRNLVPNGQRLKVLRSAEFRPKTKDQKGFKNKCKLLCYLASFDRCQVFEDEIYTGKQFCAYWK